MTREEIEEKVNSILTDIFSVSETDLYENNDLTSDLNFSGLDEVEFFFEVEDAFDIETTDDEMGNVNTIKDVYDLVENKLNED